MYMLTVILGILIVILLCAWQAHRDAPMESSFKRLAELNVTLKQYDEINNQFKIAFWILIALFILSLLFNFI